MVSGPMHAGAPFNRTYLDSARTPLRVLIGIAFLAYSSIATIRWFAEFTRPLLDGVVWLGAPAGILIGVLATAVIVGGEWALSEAGWWYAVPFIPDVALTYTFTYPWVSTLIIVNSGSAAWAVPVSVAGSLVISVAVAYGGELLLLGKRRRKSP
jgi:mannose/fructose/N-acetylgalactosamine-specific phosphotransferase system component IIC